MTFPSLDQQGQSLQQQIKKLKPSPALNVYNIFFLIERRRILENRNLSAEEIRRILVKNRQQGAMKKKRIHRKTHGLVGFKELTNKIASRWKTIDEATRHLLDQLAEYDRIHYRKQFKAWNELKEAMTTSMSILDSSVEMDTSSASHNSIGASRHTFTQKDNQDCPKSLDKEMTFESPRHHGMAFSFDEQAEDLDWTESLLYLHALANGIDLLAPMDGVEMECLFSS